MIIYPNLRLSHDNSKTLSRRDLMIAENGYASVMFAGNLHYIKSNGEVVLTDYPPSQINFVPAREFSGSILYFDPPDITHFEKIVLPDNEDLYELSSMGVDAAVICLRVRSRSSDSADEIYQRALKLRPRYENYDTLTFSEATEYYTKLTVVDPILAHLNISYITQPFGSGHFHSHMAKSASFTVSEYFTNSYDTLGIPSKLSKKTAQKYISKNIFFQNSIKHEHADLLIEKDRLVFTDSDKDCVKFTNQSRELLQLCSTMTNDTKKRFSRMAEEAVYRICSNRHLITLYDEKSLEQHALNLSIFCASQFCRDTNDKRRIKNFFNAGVRKLGDLVHLRN